MTTELIVDAEHTIINTCQHELAPYASDPYNSKGRQHAEDDSATRSAFRRDCDRIIHSNAFRRLEYKTQVFVNHEGDHYRTRLTHSLEVAQIARSISRNLSLSEDLAEAMALAHDLGHTPFGHAGEEALNEVGGQFYKFDHNVQSLKILTNLEHKYAAFDGLNVSWELLEGVIKHNGPLEGEHRDKVRFNGNVPGILKNLDANIHLELDKFASAEAQIAGFADDIAYNNHDIDDGLRAGLFSIDEVKELPMVGNMFRQLHREYPDLAEDRLIHEANRRMISRMIVDITRQTANNIADANIQTIDDIRNLGRPIVHFSKNMESNVKTIKEFLTENMYKHYKVCRMTTKAKKVVSDLFSTFFETPECLPTVWRDQAFKTQNDAQRAEVVMDYIAGMTDRFAMDEHRRLFDMEFRI